MTNKVWRLSTLHPATFNTPTAFIIQDAVPSASAVVTATGISGTSNKLLTKVTNTFYLLTFADANGIPCVCACVQQDVFEPPINVAIHSVAVSQ